MCFREAPFDNAGGLAKIPSLETLDATIMQGAIHRLRPQLLTEGTTIIGLNPMLLAMGTGSEIMKPMAAPVLGGLLIAYEMVNLFIAVLFQGVQAYRWKKLRSFHVEPQRYDRTRMPE